MEHSSARTERLTGHLRGFAPPQSTVRGAEALNRHLWRSYDLQRPSSSLPESAGTPKSDPPSWLRGCQALPQPRRPHEPHPSRRSHAHTRTPTWHVFLSARAERRTSGFPSLSSSSVNVVVMQMPHGHPSSRCAARRPADTRPPTPPPTTATILPASALGGAMALIIGFSAAARCRGAARRPPRRRARLTREVFVPFTEFLDPVDGVRAGHRASRRGSASISKNGV